MSHEIGDSGTWPFETIPSHWAWWPFDDVFADFTSTDKKLPQKLYLESGQLPVVDQGKDLIGGFTNDTSLSFDGTLPAIIFGDHTRCVKFLTSPFVQGADGVKVLIPKSSIHPRFAFWALSALQLPNKGYSRHFKFLKSSYFPI